MKKNEAYAFTDFMICTAPFGLGVRFVLEGGCLHVIHAKGLLKFDLTELARTMEKPCACAVTPPPSGPAYRPPPSAREVSYKRMRNKILEKIRMLEAGQ